jgi:diphthamide biosynthesis protein 2
VFYNEIQTSTLPAGFEAPFGTHAQLGPSINIDTATVTETTGGHQQSTDDNIPLEHTTIFYIGEESLGLTNLLMTNASCDVGLPDALTPHPF